jgi:hypothetical protein
MSNNSKDFDDAVNYFADKKNFACLIFEVQQDMIEYEASIPNEFWGKDFDKSYSRMVHMIALIRKIGDLLTKHAADFSELSENDVKKDVADKYYDLKKIHEK